MKIRLSKYLSKGRNSDRKGWEKTFFKRKLPWPLYTCTKYAENCWNTPDTKLALLWWAVSCAFSQYMCDTGRQIQHFRWGWKPELFCLYFWADSWASVSVADGKCLPMSPSPPTLKYCCWNNATVGIKKEERWSKFCSVNIVAEDGWFQQLQERLRIQVSTAAEWRRGWGKYVFHGNLSNNSCMFLKKENKTIFPRCCCHSAHSLFIPLVWKR